MTLTAATLVLGALLGMRFRVFALVPALGFVFIAIPLVHMARGDGVAAGLMAAVVAAICIQLGYLGGILARKTASARSTSPAQATILQFQLNRQKLTSKTRRG